MSAPILNSTQEMCAICHEDYQRNEISNVNKVVELACHHFYHIGCISESLRYQEDGQRDLTCCYCNQVFASSAQAINAFDTQEIFQTRLEEIRSDYDYDSDVIESLPHIMNLYNTIHDLVSPGENQVELEDLPLAIANLVIESETIEEDSKATVLLILSSMILGSRALRTVESEARRWEGTSYENLPEKIRQNGVLVRYENDIRVRISAKHLMRVIDKRSMDNLISHYQQKAEDLSPSINRGLKVFGVVAGMVAVAVLAKKVLDRL